MQKFTQWCIKHRLGWFIKILIILCFPLYLAAYIPNAIPGYEVRTKLC